MKTIIFDFDGTLTYKSPNIWKTIWKDLEYSTDKDSYFANLYKSFITKNINHQKWCDDTCEAFQDRDMDIYKLDKVVENIKLINGFEETINKLKDSGYSLHIVSGSISRVIRSLIGQENIKKFDSINSNIMLFDEAGCLDGIIGTKYDFEGKALFIEDLKAKTGCKGSDIIFIGNSSNDEWAHLSGCKTLCINPEDTCSNNRSVWHNVVENLTDLREILPYLLDEKNNLKDNIQE